MFVIVLSHKTKGVPMADENPAPRSISSERATGSWAFEITKANPLRGYTQSRDEAGHSEWVRARVHPSLNDLIWHIIRDPSTNVPWKTMGDVIRDALVQRISQVAEIFQEGIAMEYEALMRRIEWLETAANLERMQTWVTDACEYADRIAARYVQRDQPELGAQRLRAWLRDLPHNANYDEDIDDPDSDYVASYVNAKIEELEDMVRTRFRNKKRPKQ